MFVRGVLQNSKSPILTKPILMIRLFTLLLLVLACSITGVAQVNSLQAAGYEENISSTSGVVSSTITICPVKDNKRAIYTFTADDGFTNAATFFNNEFKRLDLCGSLALVANWINGAQTPASTYSFWNALIADGRIDVINHSKTHFKFSILSNTTTGQDSLYEEIIGNQIVFKSKFPGQDIITMANPSVVNTSAADVLIKQTHYAARNGSSGYNSLSPTDTEWFKLNMLANYFGSKSRAAYSHEINKYVDNVLANKQWLILLAHGIGTGANAMSDTAFTKHFEYVASKRTDLWICTFGDATRYLREKQHATILTIDSTASKIAIALTHNLDTLIFDYPLTLKTKLPVGWSNVKVTQGTVSKDYTPVVENGNAMLYFDAKPNGGTIFLTPNASSSLASHLKKKESKRMIYQSISRSIEISDPNDEIHQVELFNSAGSKCGTYHTKTIPLRGEMNGLYFVKQCFSDGVFVFSKVLVS